jgi:hypothetical protein
MPWHQGDLRLEAVRRFDARGASSKRMTVFIPCMSAFIPWHEPRAPRDQRDHAREGPRSCRCMKAVIPLLGHDLAMA